MEQEDRMLTLNVCYAFTDSGGEYYHHVLTSLVSVFENTQSHVCAYILHDDTVSAQAREDFSLIAQRYGQEVQLRRVPPFSIDISENVWKIFGKGAAYRLFIPELLTVENVLYLDSDIICELDIREIFDQDMGEAVVAGVMDSGLCFDPKRIKRMNKYGIDNLKYINSGVLLLNLVQIRNRFPHFASDILGLIAGHTFSYPDQDAINLYFQKNHGDIKLLPERYNFLLSIDDRAYLEHEQYQGKILHYTDSKPWNMSFPANVHYWKYYARYFSIKETFARIEVLKPTEYAYLFNFILRYPKVRRMVKRVYSVVEYGLWRTVLKKIG